MTDDQDKSGKESRNFIVRFFSTLGPGLITGAADDDPSGIATYSIAGAQLGTAMLWTASITWPPCGTLTTAHRSSGARHRTAWLHEYDAPLRVRLRRRKGARSPPGRESIGGPRRERTPSAELGRDDGTLAVSGGRDAGQRRHHPKALTRGLDRHRMKQNYGYAAIGATATSTPKWPTFQPAPTAGGSILKHP